MALIVESGIDKENKEGIREISDMDGADDRIPILNLKGNSDIQDDVFAGWIKQFEEYHYLTLSPTSKLDNDLLVAESLFSPGEEPIDPNPKYNTTIDKNSAAYAALVREYNNTGKAQYELALEEWKIKKANYDAYIEMLKEQYGLETINIDERYDNMNISYMPEFFDKSHDGMSQFSVGFHKDNFELENGSVFFKEGATYNKIPLDKIEIQQADIDTKIEAIDSLIQQNQKKLDDEAKGLSYESTHNPFYILVNQDIEKLNILKEQLWNLEISLNDFLNNIKTLFEIRNIKLPNIADYDTKEKMYDFIVSYLFQFNRLNEVCYYIKRGNLITTQERDEINKQKEEIPDKKNADLENLEQQFNDGYINEEQYNQKKIEIEVFYEIQLAELNKKLEESELYADVVETLSATSDTGVSNTETQYLYVDNEQNPSFEVCNSITAQKNELVIQKMLYEMQYLQYTISENKFKEYNSLLRKIVIDENGSEEKEREFPKDFSDEEQEQLVSKYLFTEEIENINQQAEEYKNQKNLEREKEIQEWKEEDGESPKSLTEEEKNQIYNDKQKELKQTKLKEKLKEMEKDYKSIEKQYQDLKAKQDLILEEENIIQQDIKLLEMSNPEAQQTYINQLINQYEITFSEEDDQIKQMKEYFLNKLNEIEIEINKLDMAYSSLVNKKEDTPEDKNTYLSTKNSYETTSNELNNIVNILTSIEEGTLISESEKIQNTINDLNFQKGEIINIYEIDLQNGNKCFLTYDPSSYSEGKTNPYLLTLYFDYLPIFKAKKYNLNENGSNELIEIEYSPEVENTKDKTTIEIEEEKFKKVLEKIDYLNITLVFDFQQEVLFSKTGATVCCKELKEYIEPHDEPKPKEEKEVTNNG